MISLPRSNLILFSIITAVSASRQGRPAIIARHINPIHSYHHGTSSQITNKHPTLLSVRGGSESTSAWNVGSRHDYRSPGKLSSRQLSRPIGSASSVAVNDSREDTNEAIATAFLNREDRNRFIARVYALLSGQLLFTASIIHAFHINPRIQEFMLHTNLGRKIPMIGLLLSSISLVLSTMSNVGQSYKWPLFFVFTIGQAIPIGFISSLYAHSTVIKAMSTTATVTGGITIYTMLQKNPRYDLSQWGRSLAGLGSAFLVYGVIHILEILGVVPHGFLPYSEAIYCIVGAGLFSLYLAHHTRLIVAGKCAKFRMNEKDYALGAMTLYSDIVNIFLYLLQVLGDLDDS